MVKHQQQQQNTAIGGHWFIIGAALLWGTTGTAQAFFGISLIFAGLVVLMMKGRRKTYEKTT
ncbi:MAG: hypothetical protein KAG12_00230 [Desulfuromusa sp.]|nr:hypothetical protein [Desulfuromusa sp.]